MVRIKYKPEEYGSYHIDFIYNDGTGLVATAIYAPQIGDVGGMFVGSTEGRTKEEAFENAKKWINNRSVELVGGHPSHMQKLSDPAKAEAKRMLNKNKNRGAEKHAQSLIKNGYSRIVQIDMLKGTYGYTEEEAEQIRRRALENMH